MGRWGILPRLEESRPGGRSYKGEAVWVCQSGLSGRGLLEEQVDLNLRINPPDTRTRGRGILPRLEESRPGGRSYEGEAVWICQSGLIGRGLLEGQVDLNLRINPPDTRTRGRGILPRLEESRPGGRSYKGEAVWVCQSGLIGRGLLEGQVDLNLRINPPDTRTRGRGILPRLEESRPGGRSYKGEAVWVCQSGLIGRGLLEGQVDLNLRINPPDTRTRGRGIVPRLEGSRPGGRSYKGEAVWVCQSGSSGRGMLEGQVVGFRGAQSNLQIA